MNSETENHGDRLVTITLTELELHTVCNMADSTAYRWDQENYRPEDTAATRAITEKMRVAWVEQVS